MVEHVKGLFGQKNAQKPNVLRLGEGVRQGEGRLCLGKGVRLGEGGLRLGEPKANFKAMFFLA